MRQMWIFGLTLFYLANTVFCGNPIHQTANQLVRNVTHIKKMNNQTHSGSNASESRIIADKVNTNQIIIFNIGDTSGLTNISTSFKQDFDQETINYCNFDPELLSNKNSRKLTSLGSSHDDLSGTFDFTTNKQKREDDEELSVNILLKGDVFNESSQITVRIQFSHQQYIDSSQLWYLVQAKSVCTNKVVGTWRLVQQVTTDTILCFKRDDTVFGHKTNRDQVVFDQTWLPTDTREDIYFVIAVFTDETYSTPHPIYFLLNSPIFKYARPEGSNKQSLDYEPLCPVETTTQASTTTEPVTTTTESTTTTSTETTTTTLSTTTTILTTTTTTTTSTSTTSWSTRSASKIVQSAPVLTKSASLFTSTLNINHFSIMSALDQDTINSAKSILISLAARSRECISIQNTSLIDLLTQKLTSVYQNVSFFDKVVIRQIGNENCSMPFDEPELNLSMPIVRQEPAYFNLTIQHYVMFNRPVKNITKVKALNALNSYISGRNLMENLSIYDTYVLEDRNIPIRFNNPCSMYNHFKICQNNGVCKMSEELEPSCSCKSDDESFVWSGQYCEIKSERILDSDKVNLLITISILATFVFVCLLVLVLYIVYKKRQQKKMMKRYPSNFLITSSSSAASCASTCDKKKTSGQPTYKMNCEKNKFVGLLLANNLVPKKFSSSSTNLFHTRTNYPQNLSYFKHADYVSSAHQQQFRSQLASNPILDRIATPPTPFQTDSSNDFTCYMALKNSSSNMNSENSYGQNFVNNRAVSSSSSSDLYMADYHDHGHLVQSNNGLICLTDGACTSYKYVGSGGAKICRGHHLNNVNQNNENVEKILLQNSRTSTNSTSASSFDCPSNGDYYSTHVSSTRVHSQHYPREITVASTPVKYAKSCLVASNELDETKNYVVTHHHHHHPNMIVLQPFDEKSVNFHYNQAYHGSEEFSVNDSELNSAKIMVSKADSKVLKKNNPIVSIKSESFRQPQTHMLPQTVEKQLAKNLQNIKIPSISMKLDNNSNQITNSYSVNEIWTNSSSKFTDTDSTSIPSVISEQQSLRDEDAWLPILSIAEEQIQKYEEEKLKEEVESFML